VILPFENTSVEAVVIAALPLYYYIREYNMKI